MSIQIGSVVVPTVVNQDLPQRKRWAASVGSNGLNPSKPAVSEGRSARLLSVGLGGRAVGRARVFHTREDVLRAVLAGLRRL
nr:hypothetical protein [Salinispora fenicalii]